MSKEKMRIYKMKGFMTIADEMILAEYESENKIPSVRQIGIKLKIYDKFYTKYRPVLQHVKETIRTLETGR
ncbi:MULTISPECIES: hypothetical protein [Paenibacillus]|uniref:hypothetical protein n=1 Tax=Paenibacillus TaxID=44249 RepID=UPI00096C3300|nr:MULTISPECIES: hypothetical protein [Paenibacillus]OME25386.1 hypothetical protein BSK57_12325 [Paenibacillus odorifer]OME36056.1 hypothetical protein BSK46_18130 [Paenibacillus odorifer]OME58705.1 hypothetical protein BSK61_07675 [Paenibacillus odorifer]